MQSVVSVAAAFLPAAAGNGISDICGYCCPWNSLCVAADNWHAFTGAPHGGKADVAFYVNVCNGWGEPIGAEMEDGTLAWQFLGLLFLGIGAYLLFGAAYNKRKYNLTGLRDPRLLPNREFWASVYGLTLDGVEYARARAQGRLNDGGESKRTSVASVSSSKSAKSARSTKSSSSKKKRKKDEEVKKQKEGKQKKGGRVGKEEKLLSSAEPMDSSSGPGWSGSSAQLAEHRDTAVHSSQQKIRVVLNDS